jgi:hypothetical protein
MAHATGDRILETTAATGTTAAVSLAGAVTGHRRVSAALRFDGTAIQVGDTLPVTIWGVDADGRTTGEYEGGFVTYSATNQITRAGTPLFSSNSGATVNFSAGTKWVALGLFGLDTMQADASNVFQVPVSASPTTPAPGVLGLLARLHGGIEVPTVLSSIGEECELLANLARESISLWLPSGDGTVITAIGSAALTATGTATAANWAATDAHTRHTRLDYLVTTAATTAVAGYRAAVAKWRGTEGYRKVFRFSPATGGTVGTRRLFAGMQGGVAAPTDVNPSTLTNMLGYGYDAADTNWQCMRNDGAGTATKVDTGVARPSTDRPGIFEVAIVVPPGGADARMQLINVVTGATIHSATFTTDLPAATQAMAPRAYHSVGGTSSVVGMTLFRGLMQQFGL